MIPDTSFKVVNGTVLHNFEDLVKAIKTMEAPVFAYHVNDRKNDFYLWLKDSLKLYEIAENIRNVHDQKHFQIILEKNRNMKILVLNAGSSSLKYQVLEADTETCLIRGLFDSIGKPNAQLVITAHDQTITKNIPVADHEAAVKLALQSLTSFHILTSLSEIGIVGHRVVHGGELFSQPTFITADTIAEIKRLCSLASLHNPANLAGIVACQKLLPQTRQVAVFDTAFHQSIPKLAFLYGIPYELYEKYSIRKYGFHGISNQYVSKKAADLLGSNDHEMIICHLGNGSSVTAVKNGESIDTSMGFTPLDGLIMGTRSGDIDPEIIFFLLRRHYGIDQLEDLLNKQSGLKGVTGLSGDMRELWKLSREGNTIADLAINMLAYRISLFVGGYMTILHGLDCLVFTGGIGENAWYVRERVCEALKFVGLSLNYNSNKNNELIISSPHSKIKVYVIPTNEELEIARECAILERND